jgi:hypothetical protein
MLMASHERLRAGRAREDQGALWGKKMKERRRGNDLRSENEKRGGEVMGDCNDGIGGDGRLT